MPNSSPPVHHATQCLAAAAPPGGADRRALVTLIALAAGILLTTTPLLGLPAAGRIPAPHPFLMSTALISDVDEIRVAIERGFFASDPEALARARETATVALGVAPNDALLLHYRGYAAFREATLRPGDANRKARTALLDDAERDLTRSNELRPLPESTALLGAVSAQRITGALSMARFGFKAERLLDAAMELDATNPRVWLLRGISAFHKPSAFGGGMDRAAADLAKAAALFARAKPAADAPSWGRSETHAWLGRAHDARGRPDLARAEYTAALRLAPSYRWVRDDLLPMLGAKR